jgi:putative transposase
MSILRTYKLSHFANENKQKMVLDVLRQYRFTCMEISKQQWRLLFNSEKLNKMADLRYVNSILSERYKRNCAYQVDGQLQGYISNRQNDFVSMVYNSSIDEETRIKLFQINRRKLWFKTEHKLFSSEQLWLARKIFKHILKRNRKPNFNKANMLLNENVAEIIPADKNKTIGFDYWIKFSTLISGKPIMIPVKSNDYFNKIEGKTKQATQFNFNCNDEFTISFIKDIPKKEINFKTEKISLDWGLKSMFTCTDGRMFGKQFYGKLLGYDKIISELVANLQRQKIKLKESQRYNDLIKNLRAYIKNEINRVFNRVVKLYLPKHINLERLNFRNPDLSKKLNRILSNCGRSVINEKLNSLQEIYGITNKEINPAYTSQECSNCHYVDVKNRKTQEIFKCKNCRRTLNADVNGSRIIDYRSSVIELANIYTNRKIILHKIVTLFVKRNPRLNSKANILLSENPYFKDVHSQVKQIA